MILYFKPNLLHKDTIAYLAAHHRLISFDRVTCCWSYYHDWVVDFLVLFRSSLLSRLYWSYLSGIDEAMTWNHCLLPMNGVTRCRTTPSLYEWNNKTMPQYDTVYGFRMPIYGSNLSQYGKKRECISGDENKNFIVYDGSTLNICRINKSKQNKTSDTS